MFTVQAAGADIWDTSDQFRFVYQQVSGDVEVVARVDSITNAHAWSKAGVMIRGSLSANAQHAMMVTSVGKGHAFQRRRTAGAISEHTSGGSGTAPVWVRLVRRGNTLEASRSSNGTSWTTVGSVQISMSSSVYVGLAVTSHNTSQRTTARLSNVRVSRLSLPSGQASADIGNPAVKGSASYSSGTYTIKAAGRDIWDTSDQFHFVYQPVSGNTEVIARVASITNANAWSKAGVMIRESLTASSRHAMMVASSGKGFAFQRRPETGEYSEHTSGGSGAPPAWVRLVRTGNLFEAYRSTNGTSWTRVGSDTIPMGETVYAGIAVTSHNTSTATTAVLTNVTIKAATATNQPPAVSLTAPTNGTSVTTGTSVTLAASATDPEGRMQSVDFYVGSTMLTRDTSSPYSTTWTPSSTGTYSLTAVAHDADGGTTTSGAVSVTVSAPGSTAPRLVVFNASSDHATNVTSYTLRIFAAGANVSTATPVATSNLGKPTPASNGEITVDRASFFSGLSPGNYQATVVAVGPGGSTQSSAVAFTR